MNTTIKSQNKEVDLDLGVIFPLDILKCQIKLDKSSSAK
ncbi:hypothetical protein ACMUM3_12885 [Enterococcus faecalis]